MIIIPFSFPAGTFPWAYKTVVISHIFQKSFLDSFPPSPATALFRCSPFAAKPNKKKIQFLQLLFLSSHSFLNLLHPSLLPYLFTEIALGMFTQNLHMAKSRDSIGPLHLSSLLDTGEHSLLPDPVLLHLFISVSLELGSTLYLLPLLRWCTLSQGLK